MAEEAIPQAAVPEAQQAPEVAQQAAPETQQPEMAQQDNSAPQSPQTPAPAPVDRGKKLFDALSQDPDYHKVKEGGLDKFKAMLSDKDKSGKIYDALKQDEDYGGKLPATKDIFFSKNNEDAPKSGVQKAADTDNASYWDKLVSGGKYLINGAVDGGFKIVHGLEQGAERVDQALRPNYMPDATGKLAKVNNPTLTDEQMDQQNGNHVALIDKFHKALHLEGDREAQNNSGVTGFVHSALEIIPSIATPGSIGFLASGYTDGKASINSSAFGKNFTPDQKEAYASVYGLVNTLAMNARLPKILKGNSVATAYVKSLTESIIAKLGISAGKEVAGDAMAKETVSSVNTFISGLKKYGVKGLDVAKSVGPGLAHSSLEGGAMMAGQQAGVEGINAATNQLSGQEAFKQTPGSAAKNIITSGTTGLLVGMGMHTLHAFSGEGYGKLAHPETTDHIDHRSANSTPDQLDALHKEVGDAVNNGTIHPIDGSMLVARSHEINKIAEGLPDHLTPAERTESAVAKLEKDKAQQEVDHVKAKSINVSPEFKNAAGNTPEVDLLQHKVDSMDDHLHEVNNGGKFKYFSDENGKYFKQFDDSPPQEIEKNRFDYEKLNSTDAKVTKAAPEQNETTGKLEPYKAPLLTDEGAKVGEVKEQVKHNDTVKEERQATKASKSARKEAKAKGKADYEARQGREAKPEKDAPAKEPEIPKPAPQSDPLIKGDKITYKDPRGKEREGKVISRSDGEGAAYTVMDKDGNKSTISPEDISQANGKDHNEQDLGREKAANDLRANPKEIPEAYDPKLVEDSNKKLNDTKKPCV